MSIDMVEAATALVTFANVVAKAFFCIPNGREALAVVGAVCVWYVALEHSS